MDNKKMISQLRAVATHLNSIRLPVAEQETAGQIAGAIAYLHGMAEELEKEGAADETENEHRY